MWILRKGFRAAQRPNFSTCRVQRFFESTKSLNRKFSAEEMMKLGCLEREILVQLQVSDGSQMVVPQGMTKDQVKARARACKNLQSKGLVTIERRISKNRWPRRVVMWAALTPFGHEVVEVFGTQLRSGGRLFSKAFKKATGKELPIAEHQKRYPTWLVPHYIRRTAS